MGLRDVFVRIRGEEDVSKASKRAGASLESLGRQAKSLLENRLVQGVGFAGLVAGLGKAVEASNELEASTRKLDGTAKITGVALETLQSLSQKGQDGFRLSATTANDFAVELAKLAAKAGDVGKAAAGMDAFLDLGAAKGLTAAQTLTAVQQSILGIDEGTDKLFNKNPSVLYQEYAAAIGTTAGKLDDQQKAQALLNAAIADGGKVGGAYGDYLVSAAGQQEQLTTELKKAAAELGGALTPALLAILPMLTSLATGMNNFVKGIQLLAVDVAIFFEQIPNTVVLIKGKTLEQLGLMLKAAGDFVPFFGDKVSALGDSLVTEGRRQVKQSEDYSRILVQVKEEQENEILGIVKKSGTAQVVTVAATQGKVTTVTAEELKKRHDAEEKAAKALFDAHEKWNKETLGQLQKLGEYLGKEQNKQADDARGVAELLARELQVNLGEATAKALGLTTDAMGRLLEQLRGKIPIEQWVALNTAVQQHKRDLSDLLPPVEALAESAKRAADENERISDEQKKQEKSTANLASGTATIARAFIDAASATGVMDDKMANVLNSAISLAANIAKAFGGDPAAIAASIASLANIIVGVGSSETEKRRLAAATANTYALERLTMEVGNLNLRESGKTFAGIQAAVDASIQARADARASGASPGEADKAAKAAFSKSLFQQGIGMDEARSLFKQLFGRDLAMADAGTFFQDIQAFSKGLASTEFGQFGSDFASQLDATIKGFDVLGISDADDKLSEFRALVGKFSPALAAALNEDLSTPEGRSKASANLQALFKKLKTGGLTPEEIGVSGNQFLSLIGTILPLLGEANGTLSSGNAASTQTTSSNVVLPTSTVGIGAPNISGSVVPAPNTTTTINGGITIYNSFPSATNVDEIKDAIIQSIDEGLLQRYDTLKAASGTLVTVTS